MFIDNTTFLDAFYHVLFHAPIPFAIPGITFHEPLDMWINDGLMTLFFLLVGLEIKREILAGQLRSVRKALLPGICALGGMVLPAAVYFVVNHHDVVALRGWAIPVATDTAFALAILTLLGSRVPASVRVLLPSWRFFTLIIYRYFYWDWRLR